MFVKVVYRWSATNESRVTGVEFRKTIKSNWGSTYLGLLLVFFGGSGGHEQSEVGGNCIESPGGRRKAKWPTQVSECSGDGQGTQAEQKQV